MKYQVMYNNGTRIRVRSGQAAFTKKEGYGISSLLLENNFIMTGEEYVKSYYDYLHRNDNGFVFETESVDEFERVKSKVKSKFKGQK